jgi:site-specific recombinase XerD
VGIQSLTAEELRAVLQTAWAHRRRDWLMILLAYSHGLRASEVVGIKAGDLANGYLTVERLKGSKRTVQPLIASEDGLFDCKTGVIEFAESISRNQRLFPITAKHFWRLFRGYALQSGIPAHRAHPHVLKHTLGMKLVSNVPINVVQQYLGHKSLSSTGEYLKLTDDEASTQVGKALRD